jgi:hypothetical protein
MKTRPTLEIGSVVCAIRIGSGGTEEITVSKIESFQCIRPLNMWFLIVRDEKGDRFLVDHESDFFDLGLWQEKMRNQGKE